VVVDHLPHHPTWSRVRSQELVEGDRNRSDAATGGVVDTVCDSGSDADKPNLANALGTGGRERIWLPDEDDVELRCSGSSSGPSGSLPRRRGRSMSEPRRETAEMAVVMPALAITLLALGWAALVARRDLALLEHGLMMPAMLVPMLFRLAGHAGHDGHGKR
jgi:hypothetical protein